MNKSKSMFPHYTWGYIAIKEDVEEVKEVPSLYVRVYHTYHYAHITSYRSLTIREGISCHFPVVKSASGFPHYTWGYIARILSCIWTRKVPSLYVRVYHPHFCKGFILSGSLTIREGISPAWKRQTVSARFPHYTWGYIAVLCFTHFGFIVPSLYVRVYRNWAQMKGYLFRSLTIREGISPTPAARVCAGLFHHYTWWYIEP